MKPFIRHAVVALSLATSTAAFAQAERLSLAFTDLMPEDPAACMAPGPEPIGAITEDDVGAWLPEDSRWYFNPERADPTTGAKVLNRCFILTVDGKEITRGIALSCDSPRESIAPTLIVSQDKVLTFQLKTGNRVPSVSPFLSEEVKRVLGQKTNLRVQIGKATPFSGRTGPGPFSWRSSVETLIAANKITTEMSLASIFALLGQPTLSVDEAGGTGQILRWYFASPMHVNPMFVVLARDGLVKQFTFESY